MLDIQLLRNNIDAVAQRLATRGYTLDTENFQKLENERKTLQTRTQDLQASRNSLSKQIGMLKGKGEDASAVMAEVAAMKSELEANEVRLGELLKEFDAFVATIPKELDEAAVIEGAGPIAALTEGRVIVAGGRLRPPFTGALGVWQTYGIVYGTLDHLRCRFPAI